ncbi:MAG: DEAD/DEAH box helicase [Hellea sp.]|nr:DEAD/DEAH box helicase [Hellea sp.]
MGPFARVSSHYGHYPKVSMTDFESLNLAAPVQKALEKLGYTTPTPIQQQAIPGVLAGRDLMGIAQTGTGKTAAFSLPLLSHIANNEMEPPKRGARALILAPTRELASQIETSVRDYGNSMPYLRTTVVFGGVNIARQIKKLVRGNDVLVATPGRLIDLIDRKDVRLGDVEILVLDEADQMMDMGFIHALRKIIPHLPEQRQTLFFSATMTPKIKKLAGQFLTNPVSVSVAPPNTTADKVDQSLIFVDKKEKQDLLALTLLDPDIERALVFTRTKHGADRVVKKLARVGIESLAIHGNKSQNNRQRALQKFRDGEIRFLIATDVAARGIDIEGISHVINYEVPNVPEQYVHRIGRTARAGREGKAIAFVDKEERAYLKDIQKLLKQTIPVLPLPENFNAKAAEVNKRPALPRPDQPEGYKPRQDPRRKKQKRQKKPKTAEQELAAANEQDAKPQRPPHAKSPHGQRPKHKKKYSGKPRNNRDGQDRDGQKPGGQKSGSHPGQKGGHSQSHTSGKPKRSGGFKRKPKPGGKSSGGRTHGRPQNRGNRR